MPATEKTDDLSADTKLVLDALRANTEGSTLMDSDDVAWRSVYLDNARPAGMSATKFRSHLSALAKAGLYKKLDGYAFGDVRLATVEAGS